MSFIVQAYDGYSNVLFDISKSLSKEEAILIFNEKTKNRTVNIKKWELDYFQILDTKTNNILTLEQIIG